MPKNEWVIFHNTVYDFISLVIEEREEEYILGEYYIILDNNIQIDKPLYNTNNTVITKLFIKRSLGFYENIQELVADNVELFV